MPYLDNYLKVRNERLQAKPRPRSKKSNQERILSRQMREQVIESCLDKLVDWRFSPFQHEALCRTSLRKALCTGGNSWQASDIEAAGVLDECFRRLALTRPSWAEGQPGYVASRHLCLQCSAEIFGTDQERFRFCSAICATIYMSCTLHSDEAKGSWQYRRAWREVRRRRAPARLCKQCGETYHSANPIAKYCSHRCVSASITTRPMATCVICEKAFRQQNDRHRCCSRTCDGQYKIREYRKTAPEVTCPVCKLIFRKTARHSVYCSTRCARSPQVRAAQYQTTRAHRNPIPSKACECCDELFQPSSISMRYCSKACRRKRESASQRSKSTPKSLVRLCTVCLGPYERKGRRDMYCGDECRKLQRHLKYSHTEQSKAPVLTAEIFDSWFKRAA